MGFLDDTTHVVVVLLVVDGVISSKKSIRLHRFKSNRDEISWECYSRKYASIDGVGFSI